jgi:hypothetical protein
MDMLELMVDIVAMIFLKVVGAVEDSMIFLNQFLVVEAVEDSINNNNVVLIFFIKLQ